MKIKFSAFRITTYYLVKTKQEKQPLFYCKVELIYIFHVM